ncbi:MAG: rhodanese-like domain-containing protein [Chloroflexi bacterium]|nr:MAG: rhodanese-like domain-containing protein [Chloroflexota bacterium]
MKKQIVILAIFILSGMIGLSACRQTDAAPAVASSAADQAAVAPAPDTTRYRDKVQAAQEAFAASRFDEAMALAREAAAIDPTGSAAWDVFRSAAVASAADDYLRHLPPRRYRIDTEHFLANQVNGTQYFIIDVREPEEYEKSHIEGAVNIPLREIGQNLAKLPESKTYPILVYCHSQKRSTHALVVLRELGYTNVYNLEGGYTAYQEWIKTNPMPTPGPTATPEPEPPSC